jgi:hypothetical protein
MKDSKALSSGGTDEDSENLSQHARFDVLTVTTMTPMTLLGS